MDKLRNKSIKTKLILLIIFFLLVPFLIFSYIWYQQSTRIIEQNAIDYSKELVEQQNRYLDSYFLNLERATLPLVNHPLIQEFLKIEPEDQFNYFLVSQQIEREVLPELLGRGDISSFQIITENRASLSIETLEKFIDYQNHDGAEILGFNLRGMDDKYNLRAPTIQLTRPFLDTDSYENKGMMLIDLKINHLKQIADKTRLGETGFIWISDQRGQVLYHPETEKIGKDMEAEYFKEIEAPQMGSFIKEIEGQKKLVTFHQSSVTNLMILSEVPLNEVIGGLITLKKMTMTIGLILILTVLLLIGGFSYSLTRSLTDLQGLMEETEKGNLKVRARDNRNDEVGKVNRSFNNMADELQRLIEVVHQSELRKKEMEIKQRDSMLKAMQSQINPHFLYNTLELINSHAIIEENGTISRIAYSLADMFRYNSNQDQFVTLEEEMEHVNAYLDIQKERYTNLKVIHDFNKNELKAVDGIRLILQPIIENVFEHGYEKSGLEPSIIHIKGWYCSEGYAIDITDHGNGMSEEVKEKYQNAFESTNEELGSISSPKNQINRIGLWNVHSRLRLTFGDNYGLQIVKSDPSGTTIRMVLPKKGEEKCFVS
ncbi:sensor histidine kinase [Pseudalkalibacillus sp. R45]|uniref:sensor histidine kinase n=1 Tax=Pseudalkalibacillus sp. R45 TaxID=3457433 RepID=UPI003FCC4584